MKPTMHQTDPIEAAVRRAAPVHDEQVAGTWHGSPAKAALLEEITGSAPVPRRGRSGMPRRLTVLLAATLALAALGGAALASGVFEPDPEDVAAVEEQGRQLADVHLPGWRPELNAETVECVFGPDPSQRVRGPVSEGPLTQALTERDLAEACADNALQGAGTRSRPDQATLCEGASGGDGRAPMPVVLLRAGSCEQAGFKPADAVRLLAGMNHRREVEISLRAATPPDRCLDRAGAEHAVTGRIAASGEPLELTVVEDAGRCWEVATVAWEVDEVLLQPRV